MEHDPFLSAIVDKVPRHRASPWRRGVAQALPQPASILVPLPAGQMCWIEGSSTFVVHCASGLLWITSPDVCRDVVLKDKEHLEMSTRGKLLIAAVADSAMWLAPEYRLGDGASTTRQIVRSGR